MIDEKKVIEAIEEKILEVKADKEKCEVISDFADIFMDIYRGLIYFIKKQPRVGEWIPVSECLPKQDEKSEYYNSVNVTLDNGRVAEGCYRDKEKEWWADAPDGEHYSENVTGHVIAWMPLPEPYMQSDHETKNRTNADRIRNMTDEELADFLMDISMGMLFDKKIMNVKSWLQSEVEE